MARKLFMEARVRLVIDADDEVDTQAVLEQMNYSFESFTAGAEVLRAEIKEWRLAGETNAGAAVINLALKKRAAAG
jgi:hypothetical protein